MNVHSTKPRFGAPALTHLPLLHQGKTRDSFALADGHRLVVATNRISTHDIVHQSMIELKGEVLTALTVFWLLFLEKRLGIKHHLVAYGRGIYTYLPGKPSDYPLDLHLYAIVVVEKEMIPIEFIVRNFLAGSLDSKYYALGKENPYGIILPKGMQHMQRFAEPISTPTDKTEDGDPPRNSQEIATLYPVATNLVMSITALATKYLEGRGIALIDHKCECTVDGWLADEALTPDSSRFCYMSDVRAGSTPPFLDKQIARDEAVRLWAGGERVPLVFSSCIRQELTRTYTKVFEEITGMSLVKFQTQYLS